MNPSSAAALTIVTVTLNDCENLKKTLASVQKYELALESGELEFILFDGNSTDGTDLLAQTINNIVYIKAGDNGVYDAMNKAAERATGKFIFFLNAGDVVLLDIAEINLLLASLRNQPEDVLYFRTKHTRPDGSTWVSRPHPNLKALKYGNVFSHQGCFISKNSFNWAKGFNDKISICSDWHLLNRLLIKGLLFIELDIEFCQTAPFGISANYRERTLERFMWVTRLYPDEADQLSSIYQIFLDAPSNISTCLVGESVERIAAAKDIEIQAAASLAKSIYRERLGASNSQSISWSIDPFLDLKNAGSVILNARADEISRSIHAVNAWGVQDRIVFLISMPRSGSTLLQRLLESSEDIISTSEPWFALPILSIYNPSLVSHKCDQKLIIKAMEECLNELSLSANTIVGAQRSYLSFLYNAILEDSDAKYYLDKTPRYVHILRELIKVFPRAKYVVLVRRPEAVIYSYGMTWMNGDFEAVINNEHYRYDFEHGFYELIEFAKSIFPNKIVINYDDLVKSSKEELSKIGSFLGLDLSQVKINNTPNAKARLLGDPSLINQTDQILVSSTEKWREVLATQEATSFRRALNLVPESVFTYFGNRSAHVLDDRLSRQVSHSVSLDGHSLGLVITCYNNRNTIISALESARRQTKQPDVVIVADDCSTDGSSQLIAAYVKAHPQLNIIQLRQSENLGVSANRDIAIRECPAEIITTLDGDDSMYVSKLQCELDALRASDASISFSSIKVISSANSFVLNTRSYHKAGKDCLLEMLLSRSAPVPRDLMFRKDVYVSSGGFQHDVCLYEDWMLKQRMASMVFGEKGWIHSGVIGTKYNRISPGLSNIGQYHNIFAQLRIVSLNASLVHGLPLIGYKICQALVSAIEHPDSLEKFNLLTKQLLLSANLNEEFMRRLSSESISQLFLDFASSAPSEQDYFDFIEDFSDQVLGSL